MRPRAVRMRSRQNLQEEVFLHLHEHLVRQVPMFEGCDDGFIKALVQLLLPQVLLLPSYTQTRFAYKTC